MKWHNERREPKTKIVHIDPKDVYVLVKPKAYMKVNTIVDLADQEVGWMEEVTREILADKVILTIHDVHILEQTVTGTTFDFTDDAWSKFADEFDDFDRLEEVNERLRGCGHSHVNMGVFQSNADEEMTKLFSQNGICKWFLVSRANKKGERQFDYSDTETGLLYFDVPWIVDHEYEAYEEFIKKELEEKIVKPKVVPVAYTYQARDSGYYGGEWWKDNRLPFRYTADEEEELECKPRTGSASTVGFNWIWDELRSCWRDRDGDLWEVNDIGTYTMRKG